MTNSPYISVPFCDPEEELKFVDADIAEACRKLTYTIGLPTQMQLARNLKRVAEALEKTLEKTNED